MGGLDKSNTDDKLIFFVKMRKHWKLDAILFSCFIYYEFDDRINTEIDTVNRYFDSGDFNAVMGIANYVKSREVHITGLPYGFDRNIPLAPST